MSLLRVPLSLAVFRLARSVVYVEVYALRVYQDYITRFAYCQRVARIFLYNFFMDTFGDKIKQLRIEKRITQKGLANLLGISTTCYAGYEQNYREPDFKILKKICIFFGVSADYLLGLEDETGAKTYNNFGIHNGDVHF